VVADGADRFNVKKVQAQDLSRCQTGHYAGGVDQLLS